MMVIQEAHRFPGQTIAQGGNVVQGNINAGGDVNIGRIDPVDIRDWLSPFDHRRRHNDIRSKRIDGTGGWILETPQFQSWRNQPDAERYLWCHGGPGTGKTILTYMKSFMPNLSCTLIYFVRSLIIDEVSRSVNCDDTGVAYIYCDYADREDQTVENMIASLIKQLSLQTTPIPDPVWELYKQCNQGKSRPDLSKIMETLKLLCIEFKQVFIVLDALDECDEQARRSLLAQLEGLDHSISRCLLTSRHHLLDMEERYGKYPQIEIIAKDQDIHQFLQKKIKEDGGLSEMMKSKQALKDEVIGMITSKAMNMFLLAELQFNSICQATTPNNIKQALRKLPIGLDNSFNKTLERIGQQPYEKKELAVEILLWISHAKRPLLVDELRQALAIQLDKPEFDEDDMPMQGMMVAVCMGLVIIDRDSSIIRLVHYSLQEYFQKPTTTFLSKGEAAIAKTCLAMLSFDEFNKGPCSSDKKLEVRLQKFPLLAYAALNWGHHAHGETEEASKEMVLRFLENHLKLSSASQVMLTSGYTYNGYSQAFPGRFSGLHMASFFGLETIVNGLLERGDKPNSMDGYGRTALSRAAENGHEAVVKLLLGVESIDMNSKDWYNGQAALLWAAQNGHEAVVKMLLSVESIDVNSKDEGGKTALLQAALSGHEAVVKLLLGVESIDVNSKDWYNGQTVLLWAARNGHEAVVKLLLGVESID
ncbi:hypothetical protein FGG08_006856, partial [Glutinoglossum americanum]